MNSIKWPLGAIAIGICGIGVSHSFAADLGATPMPVKAAAQSIDQLWNISYNSELRWFSWQDTRGFTTDVAPLSGKGHGSQLYAPMSLSVTGNPDPNWKL